MTHLGGAAYLPESLVAAQLAEGRFHRVQGAPIIEHTVHAVYPVRSARDALIREVLLLFRTD